MSAVDPAMLAVFARESLGILRADLRAWALQIMLAGLPYEARIAERNRALRAAAEFLPTDLNMAAKVKQLHAALCSAARANRPAHPDLSSLQGCLALALLARDKVPDQRQLWNVLNGLEKM